MFSGKMSNNLPDVAQESAECLRLQEFKRFLQPFALNKESSNTGVIGVETRNNVTRVSNETYPVSSDELEAELISYLWTQLQIKKCPPFFQLKVLQSAVSDIQQNYSHTKECEIICKVRGATDPEHVENESPQTIHFDLLKLQKLALQKLELLFERLSDNTEAANLVNYADAAAICNSGESCCCNNNEEKEVPFVSGSFKNKPRKMEDRQVCLQYFSELYHLAEPTDCSFFAVFDGHSGTHAAVYAASHLPYLLALQLKQSQIDSVDLPSSYRNYFEGAFLETDKKFGDKQITSGTTAVVALITRKKNTNSQLYVAWVGDSKALLVSATASLQLVKSHKPDTVDERKRIESAATGGTVLFVQSQWRVNGILNVSRSIGDYSLPAVIAEPDFVDVPLTAMHDFLVLATDGLWDHVSEETIAITIYKALAKKDQKVEDIPKLLIDLAKKGDSQDNITVVIIFLKSRTRIVEDHRNQVMC